jgi:hypothetical protein
MITILENQILTPIRTQEVKYLKSLNKSVKRVIKCIRRFFRTQTPAFLTIQAFLLDLNEEVSYILKQYHDSTDLLTTHAFMLCKVMEIICPKKNNNKKKNRLSNTDTVKIKKLIMLFNITCFPMNLIKDIKYIFFLYYNSVAFHAHCIVSSIPTLI